MQLFEHLVKVLRTHSPDHFTAWLHATARNYCLMQLRARKRAAHYQLPRRGRCGNRRRPASAK